MRGASPRILSAARDAVSAAATATTYDDDDDDHND